MVRHEHVRESSEEGALQCQPAQKPQIGGVTGTSVHPRGPTPATELSRWAHPNGTTSQAAAPSHAGTIVVKANPAYTSQRCSSCGFVTEGKRESQAVFRCKASGCGRAKHADVNAAKNIRHADGQLVSTCGGDLGTSRSVKQESVSRATGRTPS
ncbi:zinc ribbon domain-containing protein [Streptomyces sp. NPDC004685]